MAQRRKSAEKNRNQDATIFDIVLVDPNGNEIVVVEKDGEARSIKLGDLLIAILNSVKTDGKPFSDLAISYSLTAKIVNKDENLTGPELDALLDAIKETPGKALSWNTKFAVLRALSEKYEYVAKKLEEAVENEE